MSPFVTTFYSYKGGVGRTILAANAAVLLARSGKTLLWDLDIEAPGLHRIRDLESNKANDAGFFEWLLEWQKREFDAPSARDLQALAQCLLPVAKEPKLAILPAHGDEVGFAGLYQQIEWSYFLDKNPELGLRLLRNLIEFFGSGEGGGFRHIVLDSRTGITDIGGYLAALLPHVTVMVGNYGRQNTGGLRAIWEALQRQVRSEASDPDRAPLPPLRIEMVASPIPTDDAAEELALRAEWAKGFGLGTPDAVIHIPESPSLRRAERILALYPEEYASEVVTQYLKLAARLQAIDAERRIEELGVRRAEDERPEYFDPADPRRSRAAQGKRFEERVADLLRMLGYRVEPEQSVDGVRVDLIATMTKGLDETVYFVECKDHAAAVGTEIVTTLKAWLDTNKARALGARGMIVAKRFSPSAGEYAKSQGIRLFTPDDLERALLDFAPYLNRLVSEFAASPLAACYVDQLVQPEKTPKETPPLLPYATAWASGEGSRLWVLLGDYGTGKTTFTRRFAFELAQRAQGDPEAPIPLLINLRDFPNKASLADVLHEHWAMRTGERRDPQIFMHLLARGRIVLLLDSFDEMGVAQAHRNVVEQFRSLVYATGSAGETVRGNRILITCREQYFRDKGEAEQAVAGRSDSLEKVARGFDGAIDLLPRFTHEQIQDYLKRRLGERRGGEAWNTINDIYDLKSLADRPQLLDIIIDSLPELAARGGAVTAGALYLAYTNKWLEDPRIRPSERQSNSEQLRRILETLAAELWRRDGQRIHHADLYALIMTRSDLRGSLQIENLDVELRTAAFLSRSAEGYYGFSHRSFLEFFFARAIVQALIGKGDGLAAVLANERLNFETVGFVGDLLDDAQLPTAQGRVVTLLADAAAPAAVRANGYFLAYAMTIGVTAPTNDWENPFSGAMRPWLPTGGACLADVDLADCDLLFADFTHADLSRARLDRSRLTSADFSMACLKGASLVEADLTGARAGNADFSGSQGRRIEAIGIDLYQARLANANWVGADLRRARLDEADFTATDLRGARLAGAIGAACLDAALTDGLTWPGGLLAQAAQPARLRPVYPWGHLGQITAVAFSPDGRRCLTGSRDNTARLWDIDTGICLLTFAGHGTWVTSVAFSPDGRRCVTGSHDMTARLWDADAGTCLLTLEGHSRGLTSVAFSPESRRCLTGSYDKTARLWDADAGTCLLSLEGHADALSSVAFSLDGRRCLTGGDDKTARLWDADAGTCLLTLEGHSRGLTGVAFSPDGRRCLTGSGDKTARLWDADAGTCLLTLEGHVSTVSSVAFSPDGHRCITGSGDKTARLWDAESGICLLRFEGHQRGVSSVAFSPDGRRCLTGSDDNTARLWDAELGICWLSFEGHHAPISSVAFSADGRRWLTGSFDSTARVWDAESGTYLLSFEGYQAWVSSVALSADGRRCLTGSWDKTRLWDAELGHCLLSFDGHQNLVSSVAFSADGRRCLTGSWDNTARLWDTESGHCLLSLDGHQSSVSSVAFSADGRRCLTGSDDKTARLWDAESGICLCSFEGHQGRVRSVAFSADGRHCLTGSGDQTARLWDAESGICLLSFDGHQGGVRSVAFSADGWRCLTGSHDHTARLWDAESGVCLLSFDGHQAPVSSVAFSPDGRRCLTGSFDNTARLWDAESGQCLAWMWAEGGDWFHLDATRLDAQGCVIGSGPLLRAGGRAQRLKFADADEAPAPWPWIPRHWPAADLPGFVHGEVE